MKPITRKCPKCLCEINLCDWKHLSSCKGTGNFEDLFMGMFRK